MNTIQRTSISVKSIEISSNFYKSVFGFSEKIRKTVALSKIPAYPPAQKNPEGSFQFMILSLTNDKTMLGLMSFNPKVTIQKTTLVITTDNIQEISKNFELFGGKVTMPIRKGESLDPSLGKSMPSLVLMGLDPDGHFIEVINFL